MVRGAYFTVGLALIVPCTGHAILTTPTPRPNQIGDGIKLQPFGDARNQANRGCGGQSNNDPGVQIPRAAYRPGDIVRVEWKLTIPHPLDNLDTGVRVAIHYAPGDSFEQNILIGGVEGDPNFDDNTGDGVIDKAVPAAQDNSLPNSVHSTIVQLDVAKTCNYCTIQWIWAARADGGFYMGCADISITTNGLLPDFNLVAPEVGNELPQNNPNQNPGGGGGGGGINGTGDSSGGGMWVGVVIALLIIGGLAVGYYFYKSGSKPSASGGYNVPATGRAPGGPPALPPGWSAAVDPASGRTYYTNAMTNETSWEPPMAPAPPSGVPPMPQADLPPGWSEAKDEASGRVYYVNNTTGASTWEKPNNRF